VALLVGRLGSPGLRCSAHAARRRFILQAVFMVAKEAHTSSSVKNLIVSGAWRGQLLTGRALTSKRTGGILIYCSLRARRAYPQNCKYRVKLWKGEASAVAGGTQSQGDSELNTDFARPWLVGRRIDRLQRIWET